MVCHSPDQTFRPILFSCHQKLFLLKEENMSKKIGYVRVSSADQNEDRQLQALKNEGIDEIYMDKISGKNFDRPGYLKMLETIKQGDLLVVLSIDRLGRNYQDIQEQWQHLTRTVKADVKVIDMPLLDTRLDHDLMGTFIADLVLQILSFVAQSERENIRKRQAQGIAAARLRGQSFGRPRKPLPDNFDELLLRVQNREISISTLSEQTGLSKSTLYRRIRELNSK